MDLAGHRLRQCTHLRAAQWVFGQQRRLRAGFVQVFDDGHGLREAVAVDLQQWHQHLGRLGTVGVQQVVTLRQIDRNVLVGQALEGQGDTHPKRGGRAEVVMQLHAAKDKRLA